MLVERLDFSRCCPRVARLHVRAVERQGLPHPCRGRGDSAPDAHRPPQPRHGGDRAHLLAGARGRGRPRPPRPHLRPDACRPLRRARRASGSRGSPAIDPWDAVLELEPEPRRVLSGDELDAALVVAADFIDLKSPYMGGHSRRCAQLATDAARVLGLPDDAVTTLGRAALVHDFGTTAVSNAILDKPATLTRTEFDRVELHPMLTEQMLRRSPALAELNPSASTHHEKCDGSGYHKRLRADTSDAAACILAATEVYVGLTTERADRPPFAERRRRRRAPPARDRRRARSPRHPSRARRRRPRRARPPAPGDDPTTPAASRAARSTCSASPRRASQPARSPTAS